jgi:hypothetical protein
MAETREVRVQEVKAFKTSSGNTRFVLVDDEGNEYTTFREGIARKAIEAAPLLVGGDRKRKVPADQLFETLKPFKDRVADDIKSGEDAPTGSEAGAKPNVS